VLFRNAAGVDQRIFIGKQVMSRERKRWFDRPYLYAIVVSSIIWLILVGLIIYGAVNT
jgi:hypothetical protein